MTFGARVWCRRRFAWMPMWVLPAPSVAHRGGVVAHECSRETDGQSIGGLLDFLHGRSDGLGTSRGSPSQRDSGKHGLTFTHCETVRCRKPLSKRFGSNAMCSGRCSIQFTRLLPGIPPGQALVRSDSEFR